MPDRPDYAGALRQVNYIHSELERLHALVDGIWKAEDWVYAASIDYGPEDDVYSLAFESEMAVGNAKEKLGEYCNALHTAAEGVRDGSL